MCGRFAIVSPASELIEAFGLASAPAGLLARYNVAPTQLAPVLPNRPRRELELFRWGLVPSWARDEKIGSRMINARAETLAEKPSFANAFRRRRCLVPVDGFYEWKKTAKTRVPYFVRLRSKKPFALAGLWERWDGPGEPLHTFTIVTTEPNSLLARVHDRMPAVMPPGAWDRWLAPGARQPADLKDLLEPYPPEEMEAFAVSEAVNSPANDGPELVEPA